MKFELLIINGELILIDIFLFTPPTLYIYSINTQLAAVAQEAENQKEELKKQRTNYVKKVSLLKKEMKVLKEQRDDLTAGDAPPSPTTKNFIEENDRLQVTYIYIYEIV